MSWSGPMTVYVRNLTGGAISRATAGHTWQASNTSAGPADLSAGGMMDFAIECGSGGSDKWSVGFWIGATKYYRDGKSCDIAEKDRTSGQAIYLDLQEPGSGWSIKLPLSSSCMNNTYSTGS